ncbi:hypothetical protein [Klebsiella aerogenes]|uniref:hypothetical protein n=1 Tax=Klebsiella aerogenes TaxID=548 RepID=UPI001C213BB3|nr:hypothetical protein [Klebsiella aerogenes]QXA73914.1 hypothetical protein I6L71_23320 [Klebsiella aerogenes]
MSNFTKEQLIEVAKAELEDRRAMAMAFPGVARQQIRLRLAEVTLASLIGEPVTDNTAPQFEALAENTEPCVICGIVSSHPEGWHYCKGEPPIFTCPACGEQSYEDLGYGALRCADCGEHFTKSTGAK